MRPAALAAALAAALVCGPQPAAAADDDAPQGAEAKRVAADTKDYEKKLGSALKVAVRGAFVVRGDGDQADLENLAELGSRTLDHFAQAMGAPVEEVLGGTRTGDAPRVEVFQFVREKGYLDFLDRVFARIRDDTVDDRRLKLIRRQRGFFTLTPRTLVVQYQGPSEMDTVRSQVVHKTSHVLLLSWRKAGAWSPWWLLEGVATWQEMAVLSESRTYCIEVERPAEYFKPGTPEADEAAKAKMEDAWRRRARELVETRKARDLGVLAKLSLNELVLDDVIQSWSVVDWIVRERKLPEFVKAYKETRDFAKSCEGVLGGPPAAVETRWAKSLTR